MLNTKTHTLLLWQSFGLDEHNTDATKLHNIDKHIQGIIIQDVILRVNDNASSNLSSVVMDELELARERVSHPARNFDIMCPTYVYKPKFLYYCITTIVPLPWNYVYRDSLKGRCTYDVCAEGEGGG